MKRCLFPLSILLSILSGCATTDLTNSWKNPQYSGGPVTKVLVLGISSQASVRRTFEDTLAQALTKKGVQPVASYTLIPSDGPIAEDALEKAVEQAGVDGVLVTRMVGRQTEISVSPSPMPPAAYGMRWQYYGYYTGAWRSYYERQRCRRLNTLTPKPRCSGRTRRSRSGRAPRGR